MSSPFAHLESHGASVELVQQRALLDLLEVRESLEGQAAELAARRATAEDLVEIEARAADIEKQIAVGRIYSKSNVRFHLAIAHASHNKVLRESLGHLLRQLREFREQTVRQFPHMSRRDVLEHRAMIRAIRRRQPADAHRTAVQHIRRYADLVRRLTESRGDGKPAG